MPSPMLSCEFVADSDMAKMDACTPQLQQNHECVPGEMQDVEMINCMLDLLQEATPYDQEFSEWMQANQAIDDAYCHCVSEPRSRIQSSCQRQKAITAEAAVQTEPWKNTSGCTVGCQTDPILVPEMRPPRRSSRQKRRKLKKAKYVSNAKKISTVGKASTTKKLSETKKAAKKTSTVERASTTKKSSEIKKASDGETSSASEKSSKKSGKAKKSRTKKQGNKSCQADISVGTACQAGPNLWPAYTSRTDVEKLRTDLPILRPSRQGIALRSGARIEALEVVRERRQGLIAHGQPLSPLSAACDSAAPRAASPATPSSESMQCAQHLSLTPQRDGARSPTPLSNVTSALRQAGLPPLPVIGHFCERGAHDGAAAASTPRGKRAREDCEEPRAAEGDARAVMQRRR